MLSNTAPPACCSTSCVASTARAAAFARFSRAARAGLIANWNERALEAGRPAGAEVESKCADCIGTPDIKAIRTSALLDGTALSASGTFDVAGHAGADGFAAIAACIAPITVKTFTRSPIASA